MFSALYTRNLKEARRDALVSHFLSTHHFGEYQDRINTADDLYEYLLLDTRISDAVKTSAMSEAVSSLQLYIHRATEGYDGELRTAPEVQGWFAQDAFLDNWDRYNKRYSTWAGKEKLRFYAGNYVEPELRANKTKLFENLENTLSQGRLTENNAQEALMQYLVDYQELADLEYLSAAKGENDNVMYFLASTLTSPKKYYWRRLELDGNYQPKVWGEWQFLDAGIVDVKDASIVLTCEDEDFKVHWVHSSNDKDEQSSLEKSVAILRKNGIWELESTKKTATIPPAFGKIISADTWSGVINDKNVNILIKPYIETSADHWTGTLNNAVFRNRNDVSEMIFLSHDESGWYISTLKLKVYDSTGTLGPDVLTDRRRITTSSMRHWEGKNNADVRLIVDEGDLLIKYTYEAFSVSEFTVMYTYNVNTSTPVLKSMESNYYFTIDDEGVKYFINQKIPMKINIIFDGEIFFDDDAVVFKTNTGSDSVAASYFSIRNVQKHSPFYAGDYVSVPIHSQVTHTALVATGDVKYTKDLKFRRMSMSLPERYGSISNGVFIPPEGSNILQIGNTKKQYIHLNLPAIYEREGNNSLYNYTLQSDAFFGGDTAFFWQHGQYLWEIFFHIPLLIASRFATEQRFEEAEKWYKYLFSSAGYRDENGEVLTDTQGNPRYWNCWPLQQDTGWDALAEMAATTDPDIIATTDPMHYKLAVFRHTLDLLMARGDACYRQLERDTLAEAKMYYVQAQQLLGPRPDIRLSNSWLDPELAAEAARIAAPATRRDAPLTFVQWLRAGDAVEAGDGSFLPPYNDVLMGYYDKLAIRLYNLRHNLSLDGQPLSLPLFATPSDPAELYRQQSGGNGVQGDFNLAANTETGWRYPLLAEHARSAVSLLTQFGSSLLSALERRDNEQMTLLLQRHQTEVLSCQREIAQKNRDSLLASYDSLVKAKDSATLRVNHYRTLLDKGLNDEETIAQAFRGASAGLNLLMIPLASTAGILSNTPNTVGTSFGGQDNGGTLHGIVQAGQFGIAASDHLATLHEVGAGYIRREEEWQLQHDIAEKEVSQLDDQIKSLDEQLTMLDKQIALHETEAAQAQAVLDLQSSRFTGQALYNWMVGRLATLYYQMYDATVPVCMQARVALQRELGSDRGTMLFRQAVWNDLYQGLLAGESLATELQKLDNLWLQTAAQGLESTRTVSLAALRGETNLREAVASILDGDADTAEQASLALTGDGIFTATLDLSVLGLDTRYNLSGKNRFIKSIAVTLPTLLGPYQDIEASLTAPDGTVATLSHGMQDNGRFVTSLEDSRFLPFEGMDPDKLTLTLSVFRVKDDSEEPDVQYDIVRNLSDIIFHIRYIMR
jgi:hypothetical protein